jgi:hypothetical protein
MYFDNKQYNYSIVMDIVHIEHIEAKRVKVCLYRCINLEKPTFSFISR